MELRLIRTRLVDLIARTGSHLFGISYYQLRLTKSRLSRAINIPFAWWKTVIQLSSMFTNSGVATTASRRRIPAKKPGSRHSSSDNRLRFVTVPHKSSVFNYLPSRICGLKTSYTRGLAISWDFASSLLCSVRQWRYENGV